MKKKQSRGARMEKRKNSPKEKVITIRVLKNFLLILAPPLNYVNKMKSKQVKKARKRCLLQTPLE